MQPEDKSTTRAVNYAAFHPRIICQLNKCPACGEKMAHADWKQRACHCCGTDLMPKPMGAAPGTAPTASPINQMETFHCPKCRQTNVTTWEQFIVCDNCDFEGPVSEFLKPMGPAPVMEPTATPMSADLAARAGFSRYSYSVTVDVDDDTGAAQAFVTSEAGDVGNCGVSVPGESTPHKELVIGYGALGCMILTDVGREHFKIKPAYRCPKCKSTTDMRVASSAWAKLVQRETGHIEVDPFAPGCEIHFTDEESKMECTNCGYASNAGGFKNPIIKGKK